MPGTPIRGCVNGRKKGSFNHWIVGVLACKKIVWSWERLSSRDLSNSRLESRSHNLIIKSINKFGKS